MNETLIQHIAGYLTNNLPHQARHAKVQIYPRKKSVRIYCPEFDSSYYELGLAGEAIKIGFSFTGSKAKTASRLALFEGHLDLLRQKLGHPFIIEPCQANWVRAAILLPADSLTTAPAEQSAEVMLKFLDLTYPILCHIFETIPAGSRRSDVSSPPLNPNHYGAYAILSRQIDQIQAFLQGRTKRPPDETLCDWVQFCYTFELHQEVAKLFNLIDPTSVQPWLYERARRLAKVCQLRAARR